jgi:hypothetical protein
MKLYPTVLSVFAASLLALVMVLSSAVLSSAAQAGMIQYEVIDHSKDPKGKVVATGIANQLAKDIILTKTTGLSGSGTGAGISAAGQLVDDYYLGVTINQTKDLTGFLMWLQMEPDGQSAEVFKRANDDVFDLQNPSPAELTSVKVRSKGEGSKPEIVEITFLSDVSIRSYDYRNKSKVLFRLNIKKGSVFTLQ